MSVEIHVLSDKRLSSIAEWQQAIDAEGFELKLSPDVRFDEAKGFLPALLFNEQSGFECFHDDVRDLMETYASDVEFGHPWKHAISFGFGGDYRSALAAYMAATAYARATGGIVFDPQDSAIMTPEASLKPVRELEKYVQTQ